VSADIDGISLIHELNVLGLYNGNMFHESVVSILELLRFINLNRLHEVFPTASIALLVALPIPITVAIQASKIRLFKTYLRSSKHENQ
jgi:hypothetical protein